MKRKKYSAEVIALAMSDIDKGATVKEASKKYDINYNTLYVKFQQKQRKEGVVSDTKKASGRKAIYDNDTITEAVKACLDGKTLGHVAMAYGINKATLRTYLSLYKNKNKDHCEVINISKRIKLNEGFLVPAFALVKYHEFIIEDNGEPVTIERYVKMMRYKGKIFIDLTCLHEVCLQKNLIKEIMPNLKNGIDANGKILDKPNPERLNSPLHVVENTWYEAEDFLIKIRSITIPKIDIPQVVKLCKAIKLASERVKILEKPEVLFPESQKSKNNWYICDYEKLIK